MYFSGTLCVDPAQASHIEKVPPTKAFKKMLYYLTAGVVAEKMEHQTFTAVSVLQQMCGALRQGGVDNIIRLAKDDVDFYLDTEGKKADLKDALENFNLEVDALESELFKRLYLVLEHEDEEFKYLVEVTINRSHLHGEQPIVVLVNGLMSDFHGEQEEAVKKKMEPIFASQEAYDRFIKRKQGHFRAFLQKLELEVRKFIKVNEIISEDKCTIVRPRETPKQAAEIQHGSIQTSPVYHGYHAVDISLLYAFFWAEMCWATSIHLSNFEMVDEAGVLLAGATGEAIDAGESPLFDPATTVDDLGTSAGSLGSEPDATDSGGWFDWGGFGGDSDGGSCSSDGGSSCSSCSSCGGCGGD